MVETMMGRGMVDLVDRMVGSAMDSMHWVVVDIVDKMGLVDKNRGSHFNLDFARDGFNINNCGLLMLKPSLAKSRLKWEPLFLSTNPILSTMSTTTQCILSMADPTILSTKSTMPLPIMVSTMLLLSTTLSTLALPTLISILVTDIMLSTMPL